MAVSKRLRYEILRRDNHACRYCGATAPDAKLTVDHVTPTALGGTDTPDNLVTACEPCNSGKTSVPTDAAVVADVAQDAVRWAAAIKQAAAEMEAQNAPKEEYRAAFKQAWDDWTYPSGSERKTFDLDLEWRTSLERFRQAGLPVTVWPDIIETAMTNKTVKANNLFRYCCGIAWRMIGELQDKAHAILQRDVPAATEREVSLDKQAATAVFLGLLWGWAWERAGNPKPTTLQRDEVFDQCWTWTIDGTSGRYELFDVVFNAGTAGSTDLAARLAAFIATAGGDI